MSNALEIFIAQLQDGGEPETLLADELIALQSIYVDGEIQLGADVGDMRTFIITTPVELWDASQSVRIQVTLPKRYPMSDTAPSLRLLNRYIGDYGVPKHVSQDIANITSQQEWHAGDLILFEAIDTAHERIKEWSYTHERPTESQENTAMPDPERKSVPVTESSPAELTTTVARDLIDGITRGDAIVERKSEFLGHAARISHPDQVPVILSHILSSEKRISRATHPLIYAWVCRTSDGILHHGMFALT